MAGKFYSILSDEDVDDLDEDFDDDDAPFDLDRSSVLVDDTYIAARQMLEDKFEQRFRKAVSRLKDDYREVAILLHEETPYKELGCTENTVKPRYAAPDRRFSRWESQPDTDQD